MAKKKKNENNILHLICDHSESMADTYKHALIPGKLLVDMCSSSPTRRHACESQSRPPSSIEMILHFQEVSESRADFVKPETFSVVKQKGKKERHKNKIHTRAML